LAPPVSQWFVVLKGTDGSFVSSGGLGGETFDGLTTPLIIRYTYIDLACRPEGGSKGEL